MGSRPPWAAGRLDYPKAGIDQGPAVETRYGVGLALSHRPGEASMIPAALEAEITRLLATGHTQRAISRMTGVCRETVGAIARGRLDRSARQAQRDAEQVTGLPGPPRRCLTCGGLVKMPCRLCQTRDLKAGGRLPRMFSGVDDESLQLDLRDEHRARYERVRRNHTLAGPDPTDA